MLYFQLLAFVYRSSRIDVQLACEYFSSNVNLVLIDLFLREGLVDPGSEEGRRLRAGLDPGP